MAEFIDIQRVVVGMRNLTATVRIADGAPLYTSDDLEGTTRVYNLLPHIIDQACVGDAGSTFKDVMGDTEIAHLLEHVTIELLAQTNMVGAITAGRTWAEDEQNRVYCVQFSCPDDVLVTGALSSAVWLMTWAFMDGSDPVPDIGATVDGLVGLVRSLDEPQEPEPPSLDRVPLDDVPEEPDEEDLPLDEADDDSEEIPYGEEGELGRGPRMSRKVL